MENRQEQVSPHWVEMFRTEIRKEVMARLQEIIGEGTWLKELVEVEVKKYIEDVPMTTVELKTCEPARPTHIDLALDGETIARVVESYLVKLARSRQGKRE